MFSLTLKENGTCLTRTPGIANDFVFPQKTVKKNLNNFLKERQDRHRAVAIGFSCGGGLADPPIRRIPPAEGRRGHRGFPEVAAYVLHH